MDTSDQTPIFILGRAHSGNTMMATILGECHDLFSMVGEGNFFEYWPALESYERNQMIELLAGIFVKKLSPLPDPAERQALKELVYQERRSQLTALQIYLKVTEHLVESRSKTRWAQKGTSYIFQVDTILKVFPRAKFVFMIRNPLDIAASLKRRKQEGKLYQMVVGWNKGLNLMERYRSAYPQQLLAVRYEDLVDDPEGQIKQLFSFLQLDYRPEYLQIPHVNDSRRKRPFNATEEITGVNTSRRFTYAETLTPAQIALVQFFMSKSLMTHLYPELTIPSRLDLLRQQPALLSVFRENLSYSVTSVLKQFSAQPQYAVRRVAKRMILR